MSSQIKKLVYCPLVAVITCLTTVTAFCQDELTRPDVSRLGNNVGGLYASTGNVDVFQLNGAVNVSIDLYTIGLGDLLLPISMNYLSNGVLVREDAGPYGLGWELTPIARVKRIVNGVPDDSWNGYAVNGCPEVGELDSKPANYVWQVASNVEFERSPDQFVFEIPGRTGIFFIKNENGQLSVVHGDASNADIDISFSQDGNSKFDEFTIKDGRGNSYRIGTKSSVSRISGESDRDWETEYHYPNDYLDFSEDSLDGETPGVSVYIDHVYQWDVTEIHPANNREILSFNYVPDVYDEVQVNESYEYFIPGHKERGEILRTKERFVYSNNKLKSVSWSAGEVEFDHDFNRVDWNCFSQLTGTRTALSKIKISNTDQLIGSFEFDYETLNEDGCPQTLVNISDCNCKRLILKSITQKASDGESTLPPWEFEYVSTDLPSRYSTAVDYWGYYNGDPHESFEPKLWAYPLSETLRNTLGFVHLPFQMPNLSDYEKILPGEDRSPNEIFSQAGLLSTVHFPTGARKEIYYETNVFKILGEEIEGAGLRVKEIRDVESGSSTSSRRMFSYVLDDGTSSGEATDIPKLFTSWDIEGRGFYGDPAPHDACLLAKPIELTTANESLLSKRGLAFSTGQSSGGVFYSRVTEEQVGNGKIVTDFHIPFTVESLGELCDVNGGQCLVRKPTVKMAFWMSTGAHWHTVPEICQFNTNMGYRPYVIRPNVDWCMGQVMNRFTYSANGEPVRKEYFAYDYEVIEEIPSLSAEVYATTLVGTFGTGRYARYAHYNFLSGRSQLTTKTTDEYFGNNFIRSVESSFYNEDGLLTSVESNGSTGELLESKMRLVGDYREDCLTQQGGLPANLMVADNYKLYPSEVLSLMTDATGEKWVVGGSFQEYAIHYHNNTRQYWPTKKYSLNLDEPVLHENFIESYFSGVSGSACYLEIDDRYELDMENTLTDTRGNILRSKVVGSPISVNLFGYDDNYLIAAAFNAQLEEVGYTSFESEDYHTWDIDENATSILNEGYAGAKSLSISGNSSGGEPVTKTFDVDDQTGSYRFSGWVKTGEGFDDDMGWFILRTYKVGSGNYNHWPIDASESVKIEKFGNTTDWTYVEVEIDLEKVRDQSTTINSGDELGVMVIIENYDADVHILIDDIKFRPKDSSISTYTYNELIGISSEMDDNDQLIQYEYDTFNREKLTRDGERNILTRTKYHLGLQ